MYDNILVDKIKPNFGTPKALLDNLVLTKSLVDNLVLTKSLVDVRTRLVSDINSKIQHIFLAETNILLDKFKTNRI